MKTHCNKPRFDFQSSGQRRVESRFDGGRITSDGGSLLLREVESKIGIIRLFAECFTDHRDPDLIEHTALELVAQRIYALALGYEDVNDHDDLRHDPLLALLVGKADPTGQQRKRDRDRGKALAGKSTLNRLELTPPDADAKSRYKKTVADEAALANIFVEAFLDAFENPPAAIILDLDATDDPLHGDQEGRFFHGYYGHYCFLPLYIFCGEHLLCAKLRPSGIDAAAGSDEELARIIGLIRERWPRVRILVRGDSGFAREWLMSWCEANGVDFLFGLAQNSRLLKQIETDVVFQRSLCPGERASSLGIAGYLDVSRAMWNHSSKAAEDRRASICVGSAGVHFDVRGLSVSIAIRESVVSAPRRGARLGLSL